MHFMKVSEIKGKTVEKREEAVRSEETTLKPTEGNRRLVWKEWNDREDGGRRAEEMSVQGKKRNKNILKKKQ